jgi:hypothetical protein
VDEALRGLTRPLAALNEARAKRDALVPDWERLLRRLKDASRVAFRDDPGHFEALFDEQLAVQTRTKSLKRPPAPPVADPPPGQPAAPAEKTAPKKKRRR